MLWHLLGKLCPEQAYLRKHNVKSAAVVRSPNEASISNIISLNYTWNIANFSVDRREAVRSPNFGPTARDPLQFNLKLYPRGLETNDTDYVALFLKLAATDKDQVNVFYKLSIIDSDGIKRNIFGNGQMHSFVRGGLGWGWSKFVHRDRLNPTTSKGGLLHGNSLVINCEVLVIPSASVPCEDPRDVLTEPRQDFSRWHLNETLSDVVLVAAGGKELPAHKFVLATRSPVFAAMFIDEDTDHRQVNMRTDVSSEAVSQFLEYIYTGKVPSIELFASQLLLLANEYQLDHLKALCEKCASSQLSIESAINMLELAQEHNLNTLKTKTLNFIREEVLDAVEFKDDLLIRAFRSIACATAGSEVSDVNDSVESSENDKHVDTTGAPPKAKVTTFSHIWRIENFSRLCDETISARRPSIYSCKFGPLHNAPPQLQLEIQPRSKAFFWNKYVSLYLSIEPNKNENLFVSYSFSILDGQEKRYGWGDYSCVKPGEKKRDGCSWFIKRSWLLKERKELLPNDTLTILCEGQVISSRKKAKAAASSKEQAGNGRDHNEDVDHSEEYSDWYLNEKLSDVVVVTAGKEFCAHKMVLSMSSPVFAAMFQHDMKEKLESRVELNDIDEHVMEQFLAYLYTGKVDSIKRFATQLLILADKFQIDSLKDLCEQYLCTQVNYATVLDLAQMAEKYNASALKEKSNLFIRESTLDAIEVLADKQALVEAFRDLVLEE